MTEPAQYTQYETDEFDLDPADDVRRGAHRATLSPLVTGLPWIIGTVLSVAVVLGMYSLVGGGDLDLPGAAPQGTGTSAGGGGAPATTASVTPSTSAPPSTPPPTPDHSVELIVLNSTDTRGLGSRAAEQLEGQGWTVADVDNYSAGEPPTTVFYATEELAVTAEAVAAVVGGKATLDPEETDSITVVLGSDYSPA